MFGNIYIFDFLSSFLVIRKRENYYLREKNKVIEGTNLSTESFILMRRRRKPSLSHLWLHLTT